MHRHTHTNTSNGSWVRSCPTITAFIVQITQERRDIQSFIANQYRLYDVFSLISGNQAVGHLMTK